MRISPINLVLGLAVSALAVGCSPAISPNVLPEKIQSQTINKVPSNLDQVADMIWKKMESHDFMPVFQVTSTHTGASPKYVFINQSLDNQDSTSKLYRFGTYTESTKALNVMFSLNVSDIQRGNPSEMAAATRAIKARLLQSNHPVTKLYISQLPAGSAKYGFIAMSENQPSEFGDKNVDWYFAGTYAVSSHNVDLSFGGIGQPSATTSVIDKRQNR